MVREISQLGLDADLLFVDDGSPDGTGELLEGLRASFPRLIVHHRAAKLGIGSAHLDGIQWAYDQGYELLVTLDCDFTHAPSDIPTLMAAVGDCDAAVGSRWMSENSLPGWNLPRRSLTKLGRVLTERVLEIPQDATGAFRAYRLDRVPRRLFDLVRARGYAFFFESLFVLNRNGFSIAEIPIVLPARTYGHSKMDFSAIAKSGGFVFDLFLKNVRDPTHFLMNASGIELDAELRDPQNWDTYWDKKNDQGGAVYGLIASAYRRTFIRRNLNRAIQRTFAPGSSLLHAGCGSGQVDVDLQRTMRITALDISAAALSLYARHNPLAALVQHGSILDMPFPAATFDGVYNLGVMEHFTPEAIATILSESHRVLRPQGKLVLFWPHSRATSVAVLRGVHAVRRRLGENKSPLHPPEISLLRGRHQAEELLARANFTLINYRFDVQDLFIQAVIIAEKQDGKSTQW